MKKHKKKIKFLIISILIMNLLLSCNYLYASTNSELQQQQSDLDQKIEQTNTEIAGVKSQMSKELQQINTLNFEISTYQTDIDNLNAKINSLNTEIESKQISIAEQEKKYAEQKKLLDKRLVAIYESGTTTYLDILLSSETLSDFISKYYLIAQLAEYDQELLTKISNTKQQIETEKATLEVSKSEIETSKQDLESKKNSLSSSVSKKKNLVSNLSEEEEELQKQLEEFEQDKREIQQELARISAKEFANSKVHNYSSPTDYGYIFPVAGCAKSNINKLVYPSYTGHTGVDVNINVIGKNVVAVKSGTVVISKALKRSNGTYKSYGEYIVINHHDGTMTLYAHMLEGSRKVFEGNKVSQGQVIGTVGNTGNSTGSHLHFEVRINGSPVNPIPYLP